MLLSVRLRSAKSGHSLLMGVEWRPLHCPRGKRPGFERHAQPVALVVGGAPDLGVVPGGAEVLGPPLRVRLETAAGEDHRPRAQLLDSGRSPRLHPDVMWPRRSRSSESAPVP